MGLAAAVADGCEQRAEIQSVGAQREVGDVTAVVPRQIEELVDVRAEAAGQDIGIAAGDQRVVAGRAVQRRDEIVRRDDVVEQVSGDRLRPIADQRHVVRPDGERVGRRNRRDEIVVGRRGGRTRRRERRVLDSGRIGPAHDIVAVGEDIDGGSCRCGRFSQEALGAGGLCRRVVLAAVHLIVGRIGPAHDEPAVGKTHDAVVAHKRRSADHQCW